MPTGTAEQKDQPAIEIRRLGMFDVDDMRSLNALFADAFEEASGDYTAAPPDNAYLEHTLSQSHVIALAAYTEGVVVGGLVAYWLPKLEQRRSEIYIYDLAVAASSRRRGVATALIEKIRAFAHESGAWVAFVQADYDDDAAIALYSKLGTREDVMHFDIMPRRPREATASVR